MLLSPVLGWREIPLAVSLLLVPKLVTNARIEYCCPQVVQNWSCGNQVTFYFDDVSEHTQYDRDFHAKVNFF